MPGTPATDEQLAAQQSRAEQHWRNGRRKPGSTVPTAADTEFQNKVTDFFIKKIQTKNLEDAGIQIPQGAHVGRMYANKCLKWLRSTA
jgi:hypothetical protein